MTATITPDDLVTVDDMPDLVESVPCEFRACLPNECPGGPDCPHPCEMPAAYRVVWRCFAGHRHQYLLCGRHVAVLVASPTVALDMVFGRLTVEPL